MQAYRDCKRIKFRNYVQACWSNSAKYFDGQTLLKIFEHRLKNAREEMCNFLDETISSSATQCIWKALSYRPDEGSYPPADHKYVLNCSIMRKFAELILPQTELFTRFAVSLVDSLLLNLMALTRMVTIMEKVEYNVFLLEFRKVLLTLDSISNKIK